MLVVVSGHFFSANMNSENFQHKLELQYKLFLLPGDEAKTLFTDLRNKYSRDKKKIERKKYLEQALMKFTQDVKETSEIYPFLKWLEPYIKPRKTVSNYKPVDVEEFNEDTKKESRSITPISETESDHPSTSSSTSRYCREGKLKCSKCYLIT